MLLRALINSSPLLPAHPNEYSGRPAGWDQPRKHVEGTPVLPTPLGRALAWALPR